MRECSTNQANSRSSRVRLLDMEPPMSPAAMSERSKVDSVHQEMKARNAQIRVLHGMFLEASTSK